MVVLLGHLSNIHLHWCKNGPFDMVFVYCCELQYIAT